MYFVAKNTEINNHNTFFLTFVFGIQLELIKIKLISEKAIVRKIRDLQKLFLLII